MVPHAIVNIWFPMQMLLFHASSGLMYSRSSKLTDLPISWHTLLHFSTLHSYMSPTTDRPQSRLHTQCHQHATQCLLHHCNSIAASHLSLLQCNVRQQQHILIAQGVGIIAHQQQLKLDEVHHEQESAKLQSTFWPCSIFFATIRIRACCSMLSVQLTGK